MNFFKKLTAIAIALVLMVSLVGCGDKSSEEQNVQGDGYVADEDGYVANEDDDVDDEDGYVVDEYGNVVDEYGNVVDDSFESEENYLNDYGFVNLQGMNVWMLCKGYDEENNRIVSDEDLEFCIIEDGFLYRGQLDESEYDYEPRNLSNLNITIDEFEKFDTFIMSSVSNTTIAFYEINPRLIETWTITNRSVIGNIVVLDILHDRSSSNSSSHEICAVPADLLDFTQAYEASEDDLLYINLK